MSADSFTIFFGLRFDIDITDENEMEALSDSTDQRIILAKKANLDFSTGGRDEKDFHLFGSWFIFE